MLCMALILFDTITNFDNVVALFLVSTSMPTTISKDYGRDTFAGTN
jgi:hypothetical protein